MARTFDLIEDDDDDESSELSVVDQRTDAEKTREALLKRARPLTMAVDATGFDRMTVVLNLYHEQAGEQPEGGSIRCVRILKSKGVQSVSRKIKVGEAPVDIPTEWIEEPGTVLIDNRTGAGRSVNPTPKEREEDEAAVILLEKGGMVIGRVRPHAPFMGELELPVTMRSAKGTASVTVTVLPR